MRKIREKIQQTRYKVQGAGYKEDTRDKYQA